MKFSGMRSLSTTGERLAGLIAALALSLVLAGESVAALKHNYLFNSGNGNQIIDSVSGANGTVLNIDDDPVTGIVPADSRLELGQNNYGNLPGAAIGINAYTALTIESWIAVSQVHEGQFTASMAFGDTVAGVGQNYVMMQPTRGGAAGGSGNFRVPLDGTEIVIAGPNDLSDGRIHHTVMTIDIAADEMAYYVDGVQIGTSALEGRLLSDVSTNFAYLGRSVWNDPRLQGSMYEFRIYDNALSATDVATNFATGCTAACGEMYLEIDRDTGAATLFSSLSPRDMIVYEITSAKGALDPNGWTPIAENGDADSGMHIDPDDAWEVVSATQTNLREQIQLSGALNGAVFDSAISLGDIWTKSPFEDSQITLTVFDENFAEQLLSLPVFFINGVNDAPYQRSDFNLDGEIDTDDYLILRGNHLADLGGALHIDTFALGDVNGDLVNDYLDFRLFKDDFIAANGAAAFAAMLASVGGAVPEPGTFGLSLLGVAAGALTSRRKRGHAVVQDSVAVTHYSSESCRTMNCISKILPIIALLLMVPAVSNAQTVVGLQDFDAAVVGDFMPPETSLVPGARYYTFQALNPFAEIATPGVGGSGNLLRTSVDYPTGQFNVGGAGFQMPIAGNISPNRQDYNLEFDIRLVQGTPYNPDGSWIFSVGVMSNVTFGQAGGSNYFLDDVPEINNLTPGGDFQHVVFNLGGPDELFFGEEFHWNPADASNQVAFEFNTIRTPPETVTQIWEIDNVRLVLDVAPSLALVVDPANGKARLRNVATTDVTFDYYNIESTNGSLLTANFNGTTGWSSLDDQGKNSVGAGIGESWDEVVETNSANRLVEQFLLGETTLAPGESVGLGAPVNPAILNNQIGTLSLTLGGPDYANVTFGDVVFEALPTLVGDYNDNGVVDAADYTIWRDRFGQPGSSLPNRDSNNVGNIGAADYASWKANFGAQLGAGGGGVSPVPEPAAAVLCLVAACLIAGVRPQRTV
jgi:hypothetical protein